MNVYFQKSIKLLIFSFLLASFSSLSAQNLPIFIRDVMKNPYSVTFHVTNSNNLPVSAATVNFNDTSFLTDANGNAVFTGIIPAENIPFSVSKENFFTKSGLINVSNANITQEVTLLQGVDVTLGNESQLEDVPLDFNYRNSLSEVIYQASEINIAGNLVGIKYYSDFRTSVTKPVKIWVGETTQTDLTNDWISANQLNLVFDGMVYFPEGAGEISIIFDSIYAYQGQNLVVMVQRPMETQWFSNNKFLSSISYDFANRTRSAGSFTYPLDPYSTPYATAYQLKNFIPNTTFLFDVDGMGKIHGYCVSGTDSLSRATVSILENGFNTGTDGSGFYQFPYLQPNTYSLSAEKMGYFDTVVSAVVAPNQTLQQNIQLTPLPLYTLSGNVVLNDNLSFGVDSAIITIDGYSNYSAETDANGNFSIPNVFGMKEYRITVSYMLSGYSDYESTFFISGNLNLGTIVLNQVAYLPRMVHVVDNQTSARISWQAPGNSFETQYIYDDGTSETGWLINENYNAWMGNRFSVTDIGVIKSVDVFFQSNSAAGNEPMTIDIFNESGSFIGTSEPFVPVANTWNTVNFNNIPYNGTFFALLHWNSLSSPTHYLAYDTDGPNANTDMDWYYDGTEWQLVHAGGYQAGVFLIRVTADITGKGKATYSFENGKLKTSQNKLLNISQSNRKSVAAKNEKSKALIGYNVYRVRNDSDWTTLATNIQDTFYVDNSWQTANWGLYKFAVKAIYSNNVLSNPAFSNLLEKNMLVQAEVQLLGTGSDLGGARVQLSNQDGNPEHSYVVYSNTLGVADFSQVFRGKYDISVNHPLHDPYFAENIVIENDSNEIIVPLTEKPLPPARVRVITEGVNNRIYWKLPGSGYSEYFENGLPQNWFYSDSSKTSVQNGKLTYTGTGNLSQVDAYPIQYFDDCVVEFEATKYSGSALASYGVMLHSTGSIGDSTVCGYRINITAGGYYSIWRYDNGGAVMIQAWTQANNLNIGIGVSNIVTIDALGGYYRVFFNGNLEYEFTDTYYLGGYATLFMYDFKNDDITTFDYFKIMHGASTMGNKNIVASSTNISAKGDENVCLLENIPAKKQHFEAKGLEIKNPSQSKALVGYNVYRCLTNQLYQINLWTLLNENPVIDTTFIDSQWEILPWGEYIYPVKAVYSDGILSPASLSNAVDKEMYVPLTVNITTNSGTSPNGAYVVLQCLDANPQHFYYGVVSGNSITFPNVYRGYYDVTTTLKNHNLNYSQNIAVLEYANTFDVELTENVHSPYNLNVKNVFNGAKFTWNNGDKAVFKFENGEIPEGFEVRTLDYNISEEGIPCTWSVNDFSNENFAPFGQYHCGLWWDYAEQDEWLITPEFVCDSKSKLIFESSNFEGSIFGDHYYVKVTFNNGLTWKTLWDASALSGNGYNNYFYPYLIDLSEFSGQKIKIAFQAYSPNGLWYTWFIDNLRVTSNDGNLKFANTELTKKSLAKKTQTGTKSLAKGLARDGKIRFVAKTEKSVLNYSVFLNGTLAGTTTDSTRLFNENILTAGNTYTAGVTTTYLSGNTDTSYIDFVYENVIPVQFTANITTSDGTNPEGTYVLLKDTGNQILYETFAPNGGVTIIDSVRNGVYNLFIYRDGYLPFKRNNLILNDSLYSINVPLTEVAFPPANVQVRIDSTTNSAIVEWQHPTPTDLGLLESFENGFPPANWSQIITNTGNPSSSGLYPTWCQTGTVNFQNGAAIPVHGNAQVGLKWAETHQDEWLISSDFICTGNLTFWYWGHNGSTHGDHYTVKVSTDGGATWTIVWDASELPEADNPYIAPAEVDLSAYAGQNIRLAWNAYDTDNGGIWFYWFIDAVTVGDMTLDLSKATNISKSKISSLNSKNELRDNKVYSLVSQKFNSKKETFSSLISKNSRKNNSKALLSYQIYRFAENSLSWDIIATQNAPDTNYTDPTWNALPQGMYYYAVKAVYSNNNTSSAATSNVIPKDMATTVTVNVTTNAGNAEGAKVILVNHDGNEEHRYVQFAPNGGVTILRNVWKGTYLLGVKKDGFYTFMQDSIDIQNPTTLNAELIEKLLSVVNLQVATSENTAQATWLPPTAIRPSYHLHWDNGISANGIGTGNNAQFDVAARFSNSDLAGTNQMLLTKIRFIPREATAQYAVRVWTKIANGDPYMIVNQEATNIVANEWNEVILNEPVIIDTTKELWLGYNINTTTGYPAGCDNGATIEEKRNLMFWQNQWVTLKAFTGIDGNWNIQGFVEYQDFSPTKTDSKMLLQYKVYLNDNLIETTNNCFANLDSLTLGNYVLGVSAVYTSGISDTISRNFNILNTEPQIVNISDSLATENEPYQAIISLQDPDVNQVFNVLMENNPNWLTLTRLTDKTFEISGTPDSMGTFLINLSATDGLDTTETSFNLYVGVGIYEVTFSVKDMNNQPLANANVYLSGYDTLTTNVDGTVVFSAISPAANIPYFVSKTDFHDTTGTVSVTNTNISQEVKMRLIVYNATFVVKNLSGNSIPDATVNLTGYGSQTTNATGIATFYNIIPAQNISYSATKTGYFDTTGTISVTNSNVSQEVRLRLITYSVSFAVRDTVGNPIENATVNLTNYGSQTTNAAGQVTFTNVAPANDITYSVSKSTYYQALGSVTVTNSNVSENVILRLITYNATFIVKEMNGIPLQYASVTLEGYGTQITNIVGQVTFTNIYPATIPYSVSCEGFHDTTGTISVVDMNLTQEVRMRIITYDAIFVVKDLGGNPLVDATVVLNYDSLTTDSTGTAIFRNYIPENNIPYKVSKSGYYDTTGIISIIDTNVTENVVLILKTYSVTFEVKDELGNSLENAVVSLENFISQTTNNLGNVVFENVAPNSYDYVVEKEGYTSDSGNISVVDANVTETSVLTLKTYSVIFEIRDGIGNVIENAVVVLSNFAPQTTNNLGIVVFENIIPADSIHYSVSKENYLEKTGNISVIDANVTENVVLEHLKYSVTFSVTDSVNSVIEGATISFNNVEKLSDATGKAIFEEIENGQYSYSVEKQGFYSVSDSLEVNNENISKNVILRIIPVIHTYSVTFVVKDTLGKAISGASVKFNNDTILTNSEGKAIFADVEKANNLYYHVSKARFNSDSGRVNVVSDTTFNVVLHEPVGISKIANINVSVYPNPTQNEFNIEFIENPISAKIDIFDIQGKLVKSVSTSSVSLLKLSLGKGIYQIRISTAKGTVVKRVIVE